MDGKMAKEKANALKKPGKASAEKPEPKETGRIPYLETNIDRFYKLVKEKKSINFFDAAEEQDVTREQIASWAKVLEDHKLAKVHYPVFGAPVILIETEKPKKRFGEEKEEMEKKPRKGLPKLIMALAGGLMVFFGYVMFVSNPFTITLRSQVTSAAQSFGLIFRFLPYPLNIITPIIIIIAALFAVMRLRKMRKPPKDKPQKEKPAKEKEGKKESKKEESDGKKAARPPSGKESKPEKKGKDDLEDKLSRIKEELGS
jgi:hypothetical protein